MKSDYYIKKMLVLFTLIFLISGCSSTDNSDLTEMLDEAKSFILQDILGFDKEYSRTIVGCNVEIPEDQKVISMEYVDYSMAKFPDSFQGTDYIYPYKKDKSNAYHVTKFQGSSGRPIEFEWIGENTLGNYINQITELEDANYIELTDSIDETRLFVMSETYDGDTLDSAKNIKWNEVIGTDVKAVKNGVCEITELDEGYQVLLGVESKTRKGYATIYVDKSNDTVTQFVYTETLERYNDERAKKFLSNLQISDGIITQKKNTISVEAGEQIKFIPGEYFEGNPWELSQCVESRERWTKIGDYKSEIKYFETIYPVLIEVSDTKPPEFSLDEMSGYAVEGHKLNLDEYISIISVTDYSKPVKIYYKEYEDTIFVSKDLCDDEGNINITVCVEDAVGNVAEGVTRFKYIQQNTENTWMEKVGYDAQAFWDLVYLTTLDDPKLSIEEKRELLEEKLYLDKAKEGLEIAESGIINIKYDIEDLDNIKYFYMGLAFLPEKVLQKYAKKGWYLQVVDYELRNSETGGTNVGDTWFDQKRIRYTTACRQWKRTIPHEFGHFVDFVSGNKSSSAEFMALYNERKKEKSVKDNEYNEMDKDGIYRGYSFLNEKEFFADSFERCLTEPEKFQKKYPEIYEYIMKCIDEL